MTTTAPPCALVTPSPRSTLAGRPAYPLLNTVIWRGEAAPPFGPPRLAPLREQQTNGGAAPGPPHRCAPGGAAHRCGRRPRPAGGACRVAVARSAGPVLVPDYVTTRAASARTCSRASGSSDGLPRTCAGWCSVRNSRPGHSGKRKNRPTRALNPSLARSGARCFSAVVPISTMNLARENASCRSRNGRQRAASSRSGARLAGGRHFTTFTRRRCLSVERPSAAKSSSSFRPAAKERDALGVLVDAGSFADGDDRGVRIPAVHHDGLPAGSQRTTRAAALAEPPPKLGIRLGVEHRKEGMHRCPCPLRQRPWYWPKADRAASLISPSVAIAETALRMASIRFPYSIRTGIPLLLPGVQRQEGGESRESGSSSRQRRGGHQSARLHQGLCRPARRVQRPVHPGPV